MASVLYTGSGAAGGGGSGARVIGYQMDTATATTITIDFDTAETGTFASNAVCGNPDADDVLLLYVFMDNGNTNDAITTPTGWTKIGQYNLGGAATALYYKVCDGTETAVTVTGWSGSEDVSIVVVRCAGIDTTNVLDVAFSTGSHTLLVNNTTTPTGPSITTATNGALVFGFAGFTAGGTTGAPRRVNETNGWVSFFITAESGSFVGGYHVAPTAGAVSTSYSVASPSTADWDCVVLALRAA